MNGSAPNPSRFDACWKQIGVAGNRQCPELQQLGHCRNCPRYSKIAAQMLDRPPPAEYSQQRAALIAQEESPPHRDTLALVIFRLGKEWLALPADAVAEVTELRPVRPIPHRSNDLLLGLVNVRGTIHLCVSLTTLLGAAPLAPAAAPRGAPRRLVVIGREGQRWAFAADEVRGLQHIAAHETTGLPSTVAHFASSHSLGVFRWQDAHVGLLDAPRLFASLRRSVS